MRALLASALVTLLACDQAEPQEVPKPKWDGVSISLNQENIIASFEEDSMYYSHWWYDRSIMVDSTFERREEARLAISDVELDSLFALALGLIETPVITDDYVTCYAGDRVKIKLFHGFGSGSVDVSVNYVPVSDWLSLSPMHAKLKTMTFDRFDSVPKQAVFVEQP